MYGIMTGDRMCRIMTGDGMCRIMAGDRMCRIMTGDGQLYWRKLQYFLWLTVLIMKQRSELWTNGSELWHNDINFDITKRRYELTIFNIHWEWLACRNSHRLKRYLFAKIVPNKLTKKQCLLRFLLEIWDCKSFVQYYFILTKILSVIN
jgi:hypothetical protein